jgi:hypothetical protein
MRCGHAEVDFMTESKTPAESSVTVLLTATIDPKLILYTERRDPAVRLKDYRDAFQKWYANPSVNKIVFCENSGFDLSSLQELCRPIQSGKEVEFLSYEGQNFAPGLGKGYGELANLAHVAAHSKLLQSSCYLFKVTGRLYVSNAEKMIRRIARQRTVDVFCNLVDNLTYSDSRVFCCNEKFLRECLLPMKTVVNDSLGINFERILARAVHQGLSSGMKWSLLPATPRIHGVGGTFNEKYNGSLPYWLPRECFRRIKAAILAK